MLLMLLLLLLQFTIKYDSRDSMIFLDERLTDQCADRQTEKPNSDA